MHIILLEVVDREKSMFRRDNPSLLSENEFHIVPFLYRITKAMINDRRMTRITLLYTTDYETRRNTLMQSAQTTESGQRT